MTWTCFSGERCIPRASCPIACYTSVCKRFTNGPISTKLGTNIIWWRGFKYDEKAKIQMTNLKFFCSTMGPISTKLRTKHPWMNQFFSNEGPCSSLRGISGVKVHTCTFDLITCKRKFFSRDSHFQPNLAQTIHGWRGFKFVHMKGHTPFQQDIIATFNQPTCTCVIIALFQLVQCQKLFLRLTISGP